MSSTATRLPHWLPLAAAGLLAVASVPASAADITLRYAFASPASTFPAKQMEYWASEVEKRTNGKVEVQTYPGGTLLGEREMWDGVPMGIADVGLASPSYDPGRFPLTSGMSLPYGLPDSTTASRILWEVTQEFDPKEFEKYQLVAMFTTEPGHLMTRRPIRNSADLDGMRVRATGSGVPVIDALGGEAVGMAMPEVPQAVQTGVIDGVMTSREILQDFKLAENLKFVTEYPTVVTAFAAFMDKNRFAQLPDDVQQVILELADEIPGWTGNYHDNENVQKALDWSMAEEDLDIIELSPEVKADWDSRLQPLVGNWVESTAAKGLPAQAYVDRIEALRDE